MSAVVATAKEFTACLRELGVPATGLLMVHSSLKSFGRFEGGAEAVVESLLALVAQGTLVMPTYSRFLAKPEEFDPARTPSDCGAISECFRKRLDVIRQPNNPKHSMAVW